MAYRQLCAVSFAVLGLIAAGCGSGAASATKGSSGDEQAPNNAGDRAPNSSASTTDQAPTSDKAPASSDTPPAGTDAPAGSGSSGSLGGLCRQLCDTLSKVADRCSDGMGVNMDDLCDANDCQVPAGYPCVAEATKLFNCFIDNIDQLCQSSSSGPGGGSGGTGAAQQPQQAATICQDALDATNDCTKAHGLSDDDGSDPMQMPAKGCYPQGGCEMCQDDCATCTCQAAGDTDKITACFATDGACAVP